MSESAFRALVALISEIDISNGSAEGSLATFARTRGLNR
jgi:hypothetical protein